MISHALRLMMKQVDFMLLSLLALLLPAVQLTAQAHVRLINGGDYLGPAAVEAAANRLANELPNYDLRISYVLNFIPIADRYAVYDATRLLPFTAIPNPGEGFSAPSAAEKKAAFNTAIHHALSAVPAAGNTIHIVYATVVTLDAAGEEEVATKKYLHFGAGIRRLDRMKVKQVIPAPELEVLSGQAQNDAYLAAYVDELIEVLKDPDYPVTGTIRYEGQVYFHGDTIFMNYQQEEKIAAWAPESRTLTFSAKNAAAVSPVTWTESHDYRQMLLTTEGLEVRARPYSTHFTHFTALTAHYGAGDSTTLYVMPINLQAVYAPAIVETHAPVPVHIEILNNHVPFELRGSGLLNVVPQRGNTIIPPVTFTPGMAPALDWQAAGACGVVPIWVNFVRPAQEAGTIAEMWFRVRVRCPRPLDALTATTTFSEDGLNGRYKRSTTADADTLYLVKFNNRFNRRVKLNLSLAGEGGDEDYWDYGPGQLDDDPKWVSSAHGIDIPNKNGHDEIELYFNNSFPPGQAGMNIEEVEVEAFGEKRKVYLAFLQENRRVIEIDHALVKFVRNWLKPNIDGLTDIVKRYVNKEFSADISIGNTITTFNAEHEEMWYYLNKRETSLSGRLFLETDSMHFTAPRYPVPFPLSGTIPPTASETSWLFRWGPFFKFDVGVSLGYELGEEKPFFLKSYTVAGHTFEMVLDGGVTAGFLFDSNEENLRYVAVDVSAHLSYPVELKGKVEWNVSQETLNLTGEFNAGPLYGGLYGKITLAPRSQFKFDLLNFTYSYSLTNKLILKIPLITLYQENN